MHPKRGPSRASIGRAREVATAGSSSGVSRPTSASTTWLAAFAVYRELFDRSARLTLVGGPTSLRYLPALELMVDELELSGSVEIRAGLSFSELLAYFRTTDVFVCLSEHEGFCVPILEAMELGVPVVAYSVAAVTDTVGDGGVLLSDKDPLAVACAVEDLLADAPRRRALVSAGRARAGEHSLERTAKIMVDTVGGWLTAARA